MNVNYGAASEKHVYAPWQDSKHFHLIKEKILELISAKDIFNYYLKPFVNGTKIEPGLRFRIKNEEIMLIPAESDYSNEFRYYNVSAGNVIDVFQLISLIKNCNLEIVPRYIVKDFGIDDAELMGLIDLWEQACRMELEDEDDTIHETEPNSEDDTVNEAEPNAEDDSQEDAGNGDAKLGFDSIASLMLRDIPELHWVIDDILPEGLSIIAGKPKTGKSWLALQLCQSVTSGNELFGKFDLTKGGALYLALEDSERRLKNRVEQMGLHHADISKEFYYMTHIHPYSSGGKVMLEYILDAKPNIKLIIVDTMARFISFNTNNKDSYFEIYNLLSGVQQIARQHHVGILLIHHMRKDTTSLDVFDGILGSTAIPGAMDTLFALIKRDTRHELTLIGRDVDEQKYIIQFDKSISKFKLIGDANEINISESKQEILDAFEPGEILTPMDVATRVNKKQSTVRGLLSKLVKDGKLEIISHGKYKLRV